MHKNQGYKIDHIYQNVNILKKGIDKPMKMLFNRKQKTIK